MPAVLIYENVRRTPTHCMHTVRVPYMTYVYTCANMDGTVRMIITWSATTNTDRDTILNSVPRHHSSIRMRDIVTQQKMLAFLYHEALITWLRQSALHTYYAHNVRRKHTSPCGV